MPFADAESTRMRLEFPLWQHIRGSWEWPRLSGWWATAYNNALVQKSALAA
jgi:hypothetical protein